MEYLPNKHTPGPWWVEDHSNPNELSIAAETDGRRTVCWIGANRSAAENLANSELISKSPEMLELLKRVYDGESLSGTTELQVFLQSLGCFKVN